MSDFFFGPLAVTGWFVAAAIFAFCAAYIVQILISGGGGMRGTALAIIFTCCTVICSCFGMILSPQTTISHFVLGAVVTAAWPPIVIGALVLTDIYSSDRNSHRSFTARSYLWYQRVMRRGSERITRHSPASLHPHTGGHQ